jgi:hypothetical protein
MNVIPRLCLICPTRQRPGLFTVMVESVARTATEADIIAVIDADDPERQGYLEMEKKHAFLKFAVNTHRVHFMKHYNLQFTQHPNYAFYSATNDDFVYHTPGWDKRLIAEIRTRFQGQGWAYGDDMDNHEGLPTTSVVSGDICRCLGWLQVPWLKRCFGDNATLAIGRAMNRISYVPEVVIEHRHPSIGKNQSDSTYKRGRTAYNYHRDRLVYLFWQKFAMPRDIRRIQRSVL